ncbi:MAG: hypothetical protein WBX38_18670 [Candidatus Sulfotelmatobacter sp.]
MAIDNDITNEAGDEQPRVVARKPYEKPAFRSEQVFVTTALTCGKTEASISGDCHRNSSVS